MRRLTVFCLALSLPMVLAAAERDVNRDGRIDQADVTAMGRMVAGLDPVDLRFDQDGDRILTLKDVNSLLDTIPPDAAPTPGNHYQTADGRAEAAHSTGGMAFFAVRQKTTGQCVVVAGEEGISAGDTIYGVFPSFGEAQTQVTKVCTQAQAATSSSEVLPRGLPLSNDRLYRPDKTITRGRWGTVIHIGEDANIKSKVREGNLVITDGFLTVPGHGGDSEILWSHDGSALVLSGVAAVIDCLDYCGRSGSVEFFIRGDGRDLWSSGLVRHNDPARAFSVSLGGIREVRLVITDAHNGVDEDWGGWLNLTVGEAGSEVAVIASGGVTTPTYSGNAFPPILAIPKFDPDDSTRGVFSISLENGKGTLFNGVRKTPVNFSPRAMLHNFFDAVGRPPGQSAQPGQVLAGPIRKGGGQVHALLIVDTTTGKIGYLTSLDDNPSRGILKMVDGAPARSMASDDGNYALLMRRTGSGKTLGAYLYHATTGECRILRDIGNLRRSIETLQTTTLPMIEAGVSGMEIQTGGEATSGILLIDPSTGALYLVGGIKHDPAQLTVRKLSLNLVNAFPKNPETASPQRFVPIPITDRSGATTSALIVDVGSGALALLDNLDNPSKIRLIGIQGSIYDVLPRDVPRPRTISGVPKIDDSGATRGAWLVDSATGDVLFLNHLQDPGDLEIRKVAVRR